jgi:hypothetical protein
LNFKYHTDNDGINNIVDNCPFNSNPLQEDTDNDGIGDVCDSDDDNDTILDGVDSCPTQPETINNYQDTDGCPDITPAEALTNLITLGNSYGTNTKVLSTIDLNNNSAACGKLNAFINQVNANNTLTSFQKAQLIQSANTIKASIGC